MVERGWPVLNVERALEGICYESPGYRYSGGVGGVWAIEADGQFEHVVGVGQDLPACDRDVRTGRRSCSGGLGDDASKRPSQGATVPRMLELHGSHRKVRPSDRIGAAGQRAVERIVAYGDTQAQDRHGQQAPGAGAAWRTASSVTKGGAGKG